MTNLNYYLWLQGALGIAPSNAGYIFEMYHSAEEIYRDSPMQRRMANVFTPAQISKMESLYLEDTYKTVEQCASLGVDIVTYEDDSYPYYLRQISDFPIVLYVKGSLETLSRKIPIAIVGTRDATPQRLTAATELSRCLSKCGFAVVSGGAIGIDSAAHTGAISVGEETFAVLGGGHGSKYLKTNEPLRNVIAKNGATISEWPPFTEPHKGTFPIRNRIISGMTVGTIVVEAKKKSGSLITVNRANDQGRDVMALPGVEIEDIPNVFQMPLDVVGFYLNKFADKITIDESVDLSIDLTTIGNDVVSYNQEFKKIETADREIKEEELRRKRSKKREITDPVSENARRVYAAFGAVPLSINKLEETMVMPLTDLLGALTELEVFGYIELLADTNYVIK